MGSLQSHVAHAVYRVRQVSATVLNRHVADHAQYDQWCDMLRSFPRTCDESHSIPRFLEKTIPREGIVIRGRIRRFI